MTFTNCIAQVTLKHIRDATLPNSWASLFHRGQPFRVTRSGAVGAAEATTQKLKKKIDAIYDQPDFVATVENFLGISREKQFKLFAVVLMLAGRVK